MYLTGTTSSSPTYYQSDAAATYTVSGTVSDDSEVSSVTVNGTAATISGTSFSASISLATNTDHTITIVGTDNSGNTTTETRYVRVEAYYQQAARLAGTTVQTSLANTLTNSDVCTAIAGNSTAYGIMKTNYSNDMISYIASNYNTGLNQLNYVCNLKHYLFKDGATTGIYTTYQTKTSGGSITTNSGNIFVQASTGQYAMISWSNKISTVGYSNLGMVYQGVSVSSSTVGHFGLSTTYNFSTDSDTNYDTKYLWPSNTTKSTATISLSSYQGSYYIKAGTSASGGTRSMYLYDLYLE